MRAKFINEFKIPFTPYHIRNKKKLTGEEKETAERREKEYQESEEGMAKKQAEIEAWKNGGQQKFEAKMKRQKGQLVKDKEKRAETKFCKDCKFMDTGWNMQGGGLPYLSNNKLVNYCMNPKSPEYKSLGAHDANIQFDELNPHDTCSKWTPVR